MHQHHGPQTAHSQKQKTRIPAKQGRIDELQRRAQEAGEQGRVGVREGVFVEVVDVGDCEVEGGEEDERGGGEGG